MNDTTMMAMLNEDEELWYSALIDGYSRYVTAIISGISRGSLTNADIEEVAADVFFKIWLKRDQIRAKSLKAFIAQVTRSTSIDMLRKKGKEFVSYEDDILPVKFQEHLDELAIRREQEEIIKSAVECFGEPEREIFIRFYYFGETVKTIAERLQINTSTTKTKLHRSRSKLKVILQERGYDCE